MAQKLWDVRRRNCGTGRRNYGILQPVQGAIPREMRPCSARGAPILQNVPPILRQSARRAATGDT